MVDVEDMLVKDLVDVIAAAVRNELYDRERFDDEGDKYSRAKTKWLEGEEEELIKEYDAAVRIIAILHRRNRGGIRMRLNQLFTDLKLREAGKEG